MSDFFKNAWIHWHTTVMGFIAGLGTAAYVGFENGQFQLNWKSFSAWLIPTIWGAIQEDANKSNALNPQPAATITN